MTDDISQQPLARAVLATLAQAHSPKHPLGSLTRSVLDGDANLRAAIGHAWHGEALGEAFTAALSRQAALPPNERAEIERQARRLLEGTGQAPVDSSGFDQEGHVR